MFTLRFSQKLRIAVLNLLCVAWFLIPSTSHSAIFTVTNNNDTGAGSLRQAITDANSTGGTDSIVFSGSIGTITLSSALPLIDESVTIDASGATGGEVTIDGNNAHRIFFVRAGTVQISNFNVENGSARGGAGGLGGGGGLGAGGGLFVNDGANVTLQNVDFDQNSAVGGNGGGSVNMVFGGGGGLGGDGGQPADPIGHGGGGGLVGDGGSALLGGAGSGGGEVGDGGDGILNFGGSGGAPNGGTGGVGNVLTGGDGTAGGDGGGGGGGGLGTNT